MCEPLESLFRTAYFLTVSFHFMKLRKYRPLLFFRCCLHKSLKYEMSPSQAPNPPVGMIKIMLPQT